jgi:hypothetical protein
MMAMSLPKVKKSPNGRKNAKSGHSVTDMLTRKKNVDALVHLPEHILGGNAAVLKDELGGIRTADPEFVKLLAR